MRKCCAFKVYDQVPDLVLVGSVDRTGKQMGWKPDSAQLHLAGFSLDLLLHLLALGFGYSSVRSS